MYKFGLLPTSAFLAQGSENRKTTTPLRISPDLLCRLDWVFPGYYNSLSCNPDSRVAVNMFITWLAGRADTLLTSLTDHSSIVILLIFLAFLFVLTYAQSTYKFHHAIAAAKVNAVHRTNEATETPTLPYWIPILGHTLPFVFSTSRFMSHLSKTYPHLPIKIYVGGRLLQFIPHGDPVSTLHRHPRKLTNVLIPVKFMTDTGLSREDQVRGEIDELSGVLPQSNPGWEHLPDDRRWNYLEHKDFATHLSGSAQEAVLGKKFAERLIHELLAWASEQSKQQKCRPLDEKKWIFVPDLTKFLREKIFVAAVSALYGPELLRIAPDLPKTYWAWLDRMPQMFRRLPRWMIPDAYAAREKTLQALMEWDEIKRRTRPEALERAKQGIWEWDSLHGSTLTQARTKMFDEFGISKEGAALFHSAMMFAYVLSLIFLPQVLFWRCLSNMDRYLCVKVNAKRNIRNNLVPAGCPSCRS